MEPTSILLRYMIGRPTNLCGKRRWRSGVKLRFKDPEEAEFMTNQNRIEIQFSCFRKVAVLFVLLLTGTLLATTGENSSRIGKQIDEFQLPDYLGTKHSLADWKDKPAIVVAFLGTECPLARLYAPRLADLAARYEKQGVQFVAIDANQQDSLAKLTKYARDSKIDFPLLKDLGNRVADQFGATRTPEVFVLDTHRAVCYHGAVDDQYSVGVTRAKAETHYLADALDELLAGKPISLPLTQASGCLIGRVNHKEPTGDITYTNQIARVFNAHCVQCHREGQVGPFALTSYEDAVGWADTIREVVENERMPPWHANPEFGKFRNDCRLAEVDKKLIYQWIENGVPQGDPKSLPEPPKFNADSSWRIPGPDVVIKMPKPFLVPATGDVPYQYFVVDPGFKEDVWIRGAEGRPGNRSVVHHMIVFYLPPGQDKKRGEDALTNAVASFVPGAPAKVWPEEYGRRIPAGSKLVFQMHYTPNGTQVEDQSEAGLLLADPTKVQKELLQACALNFQFEIPPGAPNYHVEARYHFSEDMDLYSLVPHMHLRGKAFRFTAIYPDKTEEVLLDVPRYDFNWQNIYQFAEPKRMPEGTDLVCEARFNNSPGNPVNPDPTQAVHWGDQTWEEMAIGTFTMSRADQNLTLGPPKAQKQNDGTYKVDFRYKPTSAAQAVYLSGEFNNWKPDELKMDGPDADGFYTATQTLPAGKHEYKFVLDGTTWKADPGNCAQTGDYHNSVIMLGADSK
jgi:peroxiredoxin/mono/diheme cytochrome c family protein